MSRRKEEGRKRERKKIFFNDFHFLPMAWKKSLRPISKERKRWKIVIEHHSTWFVFFNFFFYFFKWRTSIRLNRNLLRTFHFFAIKSNQINWNETNDFRQKKYQQIFFGVTFSAVKKGLRATNIEEELSQKSEWLSRSWSPGFKVPKMLST